MDVRERFVHLHQKEIKTLQNIQTIQFIKPVKPNDKILNIEILTY